MSTPRAIPAGRRAPRVIAALTVVVLLAAVIAAVAKHRDHDHAAATRSRLPTGPSAAAAATISADYYLAVKAQDARTAYGLLCAQQQAGYTQYADEVAADTKSGTGVTSFTVTGPGQVNGADAAVPAQISLADGESTPIIVLLTYASSSWRVCSSNLGGVLPGPGYAVGPATTPTPTPLATV